MSDLAQIAAEVEIAHGRLPKFDAVHGEPGFIVDDRIESNSRGRVMLRGELDFAGTDLLTEAVEVVLAKLLIGAVCEIDMSGLEFCDSAGLGSLLKCARNARDHGVRLVIVSAPTPFLRLLTVTGTTGQFELGDAPSGGHGGALN